MGGDFSDDEDLLVSLSEHVAAIDENRAEEHQSPPCCEARGEEVGSNRAPLASSVRGTSRAYCRARVVLSEFWSQRALFCAGIRSTF